MFVWNQSTKGCNIPQRTPEFVCSHTPKYGFPLCLVSLTFGFHSKSKEKPSTVLFRTWSQTLPLPRGLWGAPSPRSPPPPPPPRRTRTTPRPRPSLRSRAGQRLSYLSGRTHGRPPGRPDSQRGAGRAGHGEWPGPGRWCSLQKRLLARVVFFPNIHRPSPSSVSG